MVEARIYRVEESIEQLRTQDVGQQRKNRHHLEEEEDAGDDRKSIRTRKVVQQILRRQTIC